MFKPLILVAALLVSGVAHAQAGPTASLLPSSGSVSVGSSFSVDLLIAGVTDLYSWEIAFGFSPAALAINTAQVTGTFFGAADLFVPGTVNNAAGTVTGTASTLFGSSGVSGGGQLARFTFSALSVGVVTFGLTNVLLGDSNLDPIFISNANWNQGQVTIVPEPSTAAMGLLGALVTLAAVRRRRNADAHRAPLGLEHR